MAQCCTDALEDRGVQISISDVASPWQNGSVESFYGRFKDALGDLNRFETVGEMIESIYRHIHYYNHSHIHTILKMPPAIYAAQHFSDTCLQKLGT